MTTRLTRTIERQHKIRSWVGDRERLDRLSTLFYEVQTRTQAAADEEKTENTRLFPHLLVNRLTVQATATESEGVVLKGEPSEVFDSLDRAALRKLEIEFGSPLSSVLATRPRQFLRLDFNHENGVKLEAAGEQTWVDSFFPGISTEIDRGQPWWTFLRGPIGYLLLMLVVVPSLYVLVQRFEQEDASFATRGLAAVFFGAVVSGGLLAVFRSVLPGFEVVLAGETGRGRRAIGIAGAVVLAALGIVSASLMD